MNWKILLVLFVAVAGLGAYLFLTWTPGSPEPEKPERDYLLSYSPEEVVRMKVVYFDTTFIAEKEHGNWVMRQPYEGTPGDSLVLNHIIRILGKTGTLGNVSRDSLDLALTRLDPPVVSFTFVNRDGDTTSLGFGVLNPTTDNIYVRRNDEDRVLLIGKTVGPMLGVNGFMVRGKGLTATHPFEVTSFSYAEDGRPVIQASIDRESGRWWTTGPGERIMLDSRRLRKLFVGLYERQVVEFRDRDAASDAETGLDSPEAVLKLEGMDGEVTEIAIGKPLEDKDYFVWARSSLYPDNLLLVNSWFPEDITRFNREYLENRHLALFDIGEVDRIELFSPLDSLVLVERNDTTWDIVKPREQRCDLGMVEMLLFQADSMGAFQVVEEGEGAGFENPQLELNLYSGDSLLAGVQAGDYVGSGRIYMRDRARGKVFITRTEEIDRLSFSIKDLADTPVRHVVH